MALLANALGYRSTIVVPETQSPEKIEMLMLCGAELRLVGPASYTMGSPRRTTGCRKERTLPPTYCVRP